MKYSPVIKDRLLKLGYDPNLSHYGLVETYNEHVWHGWGPIGRGKIRVYLPYLIGKKWRIIDVFAQNIEPNKFNKNNRILRPGDMVGFDLGFGPNGLAALNAKVIREKQRDVDVERTVIKCMNILREDGYVSPVIASDIVEPDFFGGYLTIGSPGVSILPEVLPKIEKAPKP